MLLLSLLAGFTQTAAFAYQPASQAPPQPLTAADPEIEEQSLQLLVNPLTQEELVVEANAWRDLLKNKIQEISLLRLRGEQPAPPDATPAPANQPAPLPFPEQLAQLQTEKNRLTTRLDIVLDSLEAKGGDVESWRKYVAAQEGVTLTAADPSLVLATLETWLKTPDGGIRWAWNLVRFFATLMVAWFGARIISRVVRHAVARVKGSSQLLVNFASRFVRQLCMVVGTVVALAALEVDIAPLIAAIGAAGFVVAFALQDTLSNFASGLLILAYRPFDVGDVIEAAGVSGVVDSVSLFSTHVRTFDNKVMIIPNNDIWGGTITNATASDTRRVDMVFGIGYSDNVDEARTVLQSLLDAHPQVLKDPAPVVQLNELGDSAVNFICRPWSKTEDYWTVYWEITAAVKEQFDRRGISIPYPQHDVHIIQHASE
jgi:small conductance mechanosensitive channel